jgi:hypothetical protein
MDGIQIYYLVLLVLGLCVYMLQIATADSTEKLSKAVFSLVFAIILGIPVAGRMFLWW